MCSSKKIYAVQTKTRSQSQAYYIVTKGCRKVNNSKNGRFKYELIEATQPEKELQEVVACIYPSRQKQAVQSHLQPKEHSIAGFYVQF